MKKILGLRARVLLVDDFGPFRLFAASMLRTVHGFEVVGEAQDGLEAIDLAAKLQPDLILLDVALPRLSGTEAAPRILRVSPEAKILFLTANVSQALAKAALSVGASGCVLKSRAGRDLLPALEAVLQGKRFVSCWSRADSVETEDW